MITFKFNNSINMPRISAARIFTENATLRNKTIITKNGIIESIEDCKVRPEFENLAPALFDSHINGGEEYYFTQENTERGILDILNGSHKTGTFYVLPCLITSSLENILEGISAMKKFMLDKPNSGVLGMHLEGPFLNINKRGAHMAKYVRKPSNKEISKILEHGKDVIKIWTIAPELFSAEQIGLIQKAGIKISAGHSDATYKQSKRAFDLGINLVTHLFNAMSGLHHRKPGLVGAALSHDVWTPIIIDGIHSDYGAAKVAYRAKKDYLFLISDALFLGRKKREFQLTEFDAMLIESQSSKGQLEYRNKDGNLAGSAISMGEAIKNAVIHVDIPLNEAIDMATIRPAKAIGMDHQIGKLAKGYPAIFTAFDDGLNSFQIKTL